MALPKKKKKVKWPNLQVNQTEVGNSCFLSHTCWITNRPICPGLRAFPELRTLLRQDNLIKLHKPHGISIITAYSLLSPLDRDLQVQDPVYLIAWSLSLYIINARSVFGDGRQKGRNRGKEGRKGREEGRQMLAGQPPLQHSSTIRHTMIAVLTASQYCYLFIGLSPSIRPASLLFVDCILYTVISSKMPKPRG